MPEHRKCFPYGAGIRGSGTFDANGVASNCYLELSATACGLAIRHVDYLSTESPTGSATELTSMGDGIALTSQ
jgi:hypothetical protein